MKMTSFKDKGEVKEESGAPTTQKKLRCFRCQGLGHYASECPNKKVISLVEFEELLQQEESEPIMEALEEDEESIEASPDEGELLVVRKALSALPVPEEEIQRESLFQTRGTVKGKICSVIIDNGSCTNVASRYMVDKLKLKLEPHPNPYKLQWLSAGNDLKVSHRCLVAFSIGKGYLDEVWCDVIPMDACHLLLGRPWQFDRKAIHDGYKNTYTLSHQKKHITLKPRNPKHKSKHKAGVGKHK